MGWTNATCCGIEKADQTGFLGVSNSKHWTDICYSVAIRGDGVAIVHRNDVTERIEVGVLNFEQVSSHRPGERTADLASAFQSEIAASKLVFHESGTSAESGLILKASNGDEIVIVAGSYPYSLAVLGVPLMPHIFEPEYDLDHYTRTPIT